MLDRTKLGEILGMTGSVHDGEVLNAARLAARMVHEAETTWPAVLMSPTPQPATATFPPHPEIEQLQNELATQITRVKKRGAILSRMVWVLAVLIAGTFALHARERTLPTIRWAWGTEMCDHWQIPHDNTLSARDSANQWLTGYYSARVQNEMRQSSFQKQLAVRDSDIKSAISAIDAFCEANPQATAGKAPWQVKARWQ